MEYTYTGEDLFAHFILKRTKGRYYWQRLIILPPKLYGMGKWHLVSVKLA
jgi:hypothetical protein